MAGGVELGGFSYRVGANITNAQAAMQQLQQQASNTAIVLKATLSARAAIDTNQAQKEIAALEGKLQELRTANPNKDIIVKVNTEQAEKQLASFQQIQEAVLRGGFRGAGLGAAVPLGAGFGLAVAGAAAAAAAIEKVSSAIKDAITAAVQYNIRMETLSAQFKVFAGNAQAAAVIVESLKRNADVTPFNTEEVLESGQVFLRVAQGSQREMLRFVELAEQLAATNPLQGLAGATFAIQELLAGQSESIANRFNVSRVAINRFRDEGLQGIALVEAIIKSVGSGPELVEALSKTFEGRMSTVKSILLDVLGTGVEPFFRRFSDGVGELADFLQENQAAIKSWASSLGESIAFVADSFQQFINLFKGLNDLNKLLGGNLFKSGPQLISDAAGALTGRGTTSATQEQAGLDAIPAYQEQRRLLADINAEINSRGITEKAVDRQITIINAKLADQKLHIAEAAQAYAEQNRQLQRSIELINRPNFEREGQLAGNAEAQARARQSLFQAGPSEEASVNLATVRAEVEERRKVLDIQSKRIQLAQEEYEINNRGRSVLEEQARAAADYVNVVQERNRANAQVRQDELEALRDVQRGEQELRETRYDALQERLRGEAEARDVTLSNLRDVIELERQRRDDASRLAQQQIEDADSIYNAQIRNIQRAHESEQQAYDDRIQALRDELDTQQNSSTERLQQQQRELQNEQRIADQRRAIRDAERAVGFATTITGQLQALARLQSLKEEQSTLNQRAALEERIQKAQEADRQKREEVERKIQAIQREQRENDRKFQAEQQAREIAREQELEARRIAERQAEEVERNKRREEDLQIKQQEEANRLADAAADAALREQKQADRLADQAAAEALKALQTELRARERADQAALEEAQANSRAAQRAAEEEKYQRELAHQQQLDTISLARIADEYKLLEAEAQAVASGNTPGIVAAKSALARLEYTAAILTAEKDIEEAYKRQQVLPLMKQLQDNKDAEYARTAAAVELVSQYDIQILRLQTMKSNIDAIVAGLKVTQTEILTILESIIAKHNEAQRLAEKSGSGQAGEGQGPIGATLNNVFGGASWNPIENVGANAANAIIEGFNNILKGNTNFIGVNAYIDAFKAVWDAALEIGSPSRWAERSAQSVIDGFINVLSGPQLSGSLAVAFQNIWNEAVVVVDSIIVEVGARMQFLTDTIISYGATILAALVQPFNDFMVLVGEYNAHFEQIGANLSTSLASGYSRAASIEEAIVGTLNHVITYTFSVYNQIFETIGWNLGQSFLNGWSRAVQDLTIPTTSSGGYSADDPYAQRAIGGDVYPFRTYKINEGQQYSEFFSMGNVIPPEAFAREVAGALGGQIGSSGGGISVQVMVADGAVTVKSDVDTNGLGQRLGNAVAQALVGELRGGLRRNSKPVTQKVVGATRA